MAIGIVIVPTLLLAIFFRIIPRLELGGDIPQADPQCIITQRMHTKHIISGLWIESCHVIDSTLELGLGLDMLG